MVEQEPPAGLDPIDQGIRLFNEEYFFEAHEVLEDLWKREPGKSKVFLQGLIQICAAYHHFQNGNLIGAETLLDRGKRRTESLSSRASNARARDLRTRAPGADHGHPGRRKPGILTSPTAGVGYKNSERSSSGSSTPRGWRTGEPFFRAGSRSSYVGTFSVR
ncbi:MAG: DUF309 domain-containing protein [Methanobacteriota archaeon]|nr:MAG: DUF309 domain-containing protein [Euryarchaeota archaeon]